MAELGEVGSLGALLEKDEGIRFDARDKKQLTSWPEDADGIPSCAACSCNLRLLLLVLEWWGKQSAKPRPIPIDIVRREARGS